MQTRPIQGYGPTLNSVLASASGSWNGADDMEVVPRRVRRVEEGSLARSDEVASALDENAYLANGLLCGDRRHVMFDEPGILLGADFLLAWSRLKPTLLLGRIVATAHRGDVLAEADRIARESAERNPACRAKLASSMKIYRMWWEALQVPMAIAWKRFRSSIRQQSGG